MTFPIKRFVLKSTIHFRVQVREQGVKCEDFKRLVWGNVKERQANVTDTSTELFSNSWTGSCAHIKKQKIQPKICLNIN